MHENGFIHGDLKPLNIMRVAAKMKLIDLDSACEHLTGIVNVPIPPFQHTRSIHVSNHI